MKTPSESLEAQYDSVVSILFEYTLFSTRILKRVNLRGWLHGDVLLWQWLEKSWGNRK
jgi:hypothetical protein